MYFKSAGLVKAVLLHKSAALFKFVLFCPLLAKQLSPWDQSETNRDLLSSISLKVVSASHVSGLISFTQKKNFLAFEECVWMFVCVCYFCVQSVPLQWHIFIFPSFCLCFEIVPWLYYCCNIWGEMFICFLFFHTGWWFAACSFPSWFGVFWLTCGLDSRMLTIGLPR